MSREIFGAAEGSRTLIAFAENEVS